MIYSIISFPFILGWVAGFILHYIIHQHTEKKTNKFFISILIKIKIVFFSNWLFFSVIIFVLNNRVKSIKNRHYKNRRKKKFRCFFLFTLSDIIKSIFWLWDNKERTILLVSKAPPSGMNFTDKNVYLVKINNLYAIIKLCTSSNNEQKTIEYSSI